MPRKNITISDDLKEVIMVQFHAGNTIHEIALTHNLYLATVREALADVLVVRENCPRPIDPQVAKAKTKIQKQLRYRETRRNSRSGIR